MKRKEEICEQISAKRLKLDHLSNQKLELEEELKQLKCQYNDFNDINALPFEMLCLILKQVPLQDLLQCEQVCQKWSEITRQLRIDEVVIAKRGEVPNYWYHNGQPVQPSSIIVRTDLNFDRFESTFLPGIKRLKICNSSDDSQLNRTPYVPLLENVEFLQRLTHLEVLEIAKFKFDEKVNLTLPKLNFLAIRNLVSELNLDCPNLERVRIDQADWYPDYPFKEKITHLYLGGSRGLYRNNEMFNNLQYICWKADSHFCSNPTLPTNRTLKVISVRPKVGRYYYKYSKRNFLKFLEEKRAAGRRDLKLVFFGVLLEDAAQLENLDDEGDDFKDLTRLQLRNYDKLCDEELRWIKIINYSTVMRYIGDGTIESVPADLHQRFASVREVCADAKVEDEQHLMEFLRPFRRLEKFSASVAPMDAAFYERLAFEFPQIRKLSIRKTSKQLEDLEFIFKFPNLVELTIKFLKLTKEFVRKLFTTYPVFKFTFARDHRYNTDTETFKRAHPQMRIEYVSHESRDFYDAQELIEYYFRNYIHEEANDQQAAESGESDGSDSD